MTGWKTWATAAGLVAYGWIGFVLELHGADRAMELTLSAGALVGIGHKIEKATK